MSTRTIVIFLVFLLVCHEVVNVEGRHLKPKRCKRCSSLNIRHSDEENTMNVNVVKGMSDNRHDFDTYSSQPKQTSKADQIDDFRPTAPGHSPGVGHSINN